MVGCRVERELVVAQPQAVVAGLDGAGIGDAELDPGTGIHPSSASYR